MLLLVLKIIAGISLLPFLLAFIASLMIRMRIPRENPLGVPWDKVALYTDKTVEPASDLIKKFKLYSTGIISAVGMIIFGFAIPHFLPPESYKNIDLHYYLTLGIGVIGGAVVGLLTANLVFIFNGLKCLREIRDLLKDRNSD